MDRIKTVIITGGSSGIGLAAAHLFVKDGYRVAITGRNAKNLELAGAQLRSAGGDVITAVNDVADFAATQQTAAEIIKQLGTVGVLVNNAGISMPKYIIDMSEEDWDHTINVNLKGQFNWCKPCLPLMLGQKFGRIINISSMSAKHGGGYGSVSKACYAASKAGILGFTKGLAKEAAPYVLVNALCPGIIRTPMTEHMISAKYDELLKLIPLERYGTAEDIAEMIFFLAGKGGDYITGEAIDINGGVHID